MGSFSDLANSLNKEAEELKVSAIAVKRRCALAMLRNLVMGTPVGNKDIWAEPDKAPVGYVGGRARANWFVSVGTPNTSMVDNVDASGGVSIGRGDGVLKSVRLGQTIYICNNLPYIGALNDGHSRQAPSGFVDVALRNGMQQGLAAGLTPKTE